MVPFRRFNRPRLPAEDFCATDPVEDSYNADRSEISPTNYHVENVDDAYSINDPPACLLVENAQSHELDIDLMEATSAVEHMRQNYSVVDLKENKNKPEMREALLPSHDAIYLYIQTRDPNIFSVDIGHGPFAEELTRNATINSWFKVDGVYGYIFRRYGEPDVWGNPPAAEDELVPEPNNVAQALRVIQEAQPIIHLTYYPMKGFAQATVVTFLGVSLVVQSMVPRNHTIDISREPLAQALKTHAEDVGLDIPVEAEGIAACFVDSASTARVRFLFAVD
ncbi:hypothetical protein KJ359_000640 [Pestalotiopsis sp. 9143b]|nr:hypothetical protein KJ359_000640 [Pestalotiopsis sp. 9143b]